MNLEVVIVAIISALPGLIALIGQLRKDRAQAASTEAEAEQLRAEINKSMLVMVKAENDELNKKIEQQGKDHRAELEQQKAEHDAEIAQIKATHEARDKELRNRLKDYEISLDNLRAQSASMIEQLRQKDRIIEDMRAEIERQSAIIVELQHDNAELRAEIDQLRANQNQEPSA